MMGDKDPQRTLYYNLSLETFVPPAPGAEGTQLIPENDRHAKMMEDQLQTALSAAC
jgi:hypothetical protein